MSLDNCLQAISEEDTPLSAPVFTELSDLSPGEVGRFARIWFKVSPERKQKVVERMVELAEDNAELDFSSVFKLSLKDSHDTVRELAIKGLWEFEDRSLIQPLVGILISDNSWKVRAASALALGKFAFLAQDGKILSKDGQLIIDSLMKALRSEDESMEVRRRALESVAAFNNPEINEYIEWAYSSQDLDLKCSSIYAMGQTGDPPWLPVLFKELQSTSPPIRYEAANACGGMNNEEATPYLLPLLHDDDYQVQLAAVSALGEIGGTLAKKALRKSLKEGDPVLEDAARHALENIQGTEDPVGFNFQQ